jgi:hypothetical protein
MGKRICIIVLGLRNGLRSGIRTRIRPRTATGTATAISIGLMTARTVTSQTLLLTLALAPR